MAFLNKEPSKSHRILTFYLLIDYKQICRRPTEPDEYTGFYISNLMKYKKKKLDAECFIDCLKFYPRLSSEYSIWTEIHIFLLFL